MLQAAGMQPLQTYIDRRQVMMADWVATCPIFEVCAQEEIWGMQAGGGGRWAPW